MSQTKSVSLGKPKFRRVLGIEAKASNVGEKTASVEEKTAGARVQAGTFDECFNALGES